MSKMKSTTFVNKVKDIANNYKTLYVMGAFGAPMTAANKKRYINNGADGSYNARPERKRMIENASSDTFGFDCVCLIKGVLWGWYGNLKATYGGAKYASNGVPDINADQMINKCSGVSANFANVKPGEMMWKPGHAGVYIGNGLAVECTPAWKNKVQITAVANIGQKEGYASRTWSKHGRLPWVEYVDEEPAPEPKPENGKKSVDEVAREVIDGKWGNGETRKLRLISAGYDYAAVQRAVNDILRGKKTVDQIAHEVIAGKWGNGATRKVKLIAAGYDYYAVQMRVNEILGG